ncbi:MAG: Rieske (2Fe-2S) protein [Planctomycetota bacterium]|nr:Rieske (2Fe-2S) protein [Planctomycetota bacterium]
MPEIPRRDFLKSLAWTTFGATVAGGAVPLGAILGPAPPAGSLGPPRKPIGLETEIAEGSMRREVLQGKPVIVIRDAKGIRAFSSRCTHLGCLVRWDGDSGEIRCPCHGGRFDTNGKVLGGPPPSELESIPVSIQDGDVWIGD